MVYCALAGCYNHSSKKSTTEKISYFHLPSDNISNIRRQDLPANYNNINACHIHFEEDQLQLHLQVCGFLSAIKTLSSFASFHVFNVWKRILQVITVSLKIYFRKNYHIKNQSNDFQNVLNI